MLQATSLEHTSSPSLKCSAGDTCQSVFISGADGYIVRLLSSAVRFGSLQYRYTFRLTSLNDQLSVYILADHRESGVSKNLEQSLDSHLWICGETPPPCCHCFHFCKDRILYLSYMKLSYVQHLPQLCCFSSKTSLACRSHTEYTRLHDSLTPSSSVSLHFFLSFYTTQLGD